MPLFQVFEQPVGVDGNSSTAKTIIIAQRFSAVAAWLPPLWAIYHRLWRVLIMWIIATVALSLSALYLGGVVFWLYVFGVVWLGFEAHYLRASALRRNNYVNRGDLIASSIDLAEVEWVKMTLAQESAPPSLSGVEA